MTRTLMASGRERGAMTPIVSPNRLRWQGLGHTTNIASHLAATANDAHVLAPVIRAEVLTPRDEAILDEVIGQMAIEAARRSGQIVRRPIIEISAIARAGELAYAGASTV